MIFSITKQFFLRNKNKHKIFILYLIQRDDCETFTIAKDIDPNYAIALNKAIKSNFFIKLNVFIKI